MEDTSQVVVDTDIFVGFIIGANTNAFRSTKRSRQELIDHIVYSQMRLLTEKARNSDTWVKLSEDRFASSPQYHLDRSTHFVVTQRLQVSVPVDRGLSGVDALRIVIKYYADTTYKIAQSFEVVGAVVACGSAIWDDAQVTASEMAQAEIDNLCAQYPGSTARTTGGTYCTTTRISEGDRADDEALRAVVATYLLRLPPPPSPLELLAQSSGSEESAQA